MTRLLVKIMLCLLGLAVSLNACSANPPGELKVRYETAKAGYERARREGRGGAQLEALAAQAEGAHKSGDWRSLSSLLEQMESVLLKADVDRRELVQPGGKAAARQGERQPTQGGAMNAEFSSELELLKELFQSRAFRKLIELRSSVVKVDDQGALGRNRKRFSDVAAQRDVIWLLLRGLADRDYAALEASVRAMEYGFRHQTASGNFKNALGYSATTAMTADAFFLQGFGHVYLLLAEDSLGKSLLPRLQNLEPKLRKAMRWLGDSRAELLRQDRNAPNRLAFDALAFLLNGKILADSELQIAGLEFIRANLDQQRGDGVFLEHGGHDSSYQAVNALVLQSAWFYLQDQALKLRVYQAVQQGLAWQHTRIEQSGRILVEGNTRTGLGQEKLFGKVKDVNYPEVALALFYWARLGDEPRFEQLAASVTEYAAQNAQ